MLPVSPTTSQRHGVLLVLLLVSLLLLLLVLELPHGALVAFRIMTMWYFLMSFADWALHRYVLHDDRTPMPHWRQGHRKHHVEYDSGIGHSGVSVTFPHVDTLLIALVTFPLGLLVALANIAQTWTPAMLLSVALAHVAAITVVIGIHNYAHSCFHFYNPPPWRSHACVPVPELLLELLHEHHLRHHEDSRVNYCTVLLGFDLFAGTVPSSERSLFDCWPRPFFWSHVPHDPITGQPILHGPPAQVRASKESVAAGRAVADLRASIVSRPSAISKLDAASNEDAPTVV